MRRAIRRRNGNVVVAVAVCLVALLSVVALSLDGGMMVDKRRQVQSAADAAALAAADDLYVNWYTTRLTGGLPGLDTRSASATTAALAAAKANGFENGVNGCVVEVYIPPVTGPFAGQAGHSEVIISTKQRRYFSQVFGSSDVPIGARAVSRGKRSSFRNAILVLNPLDKSAFNASGNGTVSVTGSPLQVNSTNAAAMIANGGGFVSADSFNVGGSPGYATPGGGQFVGPIVPNSEPIPDPYSNLPPPDPNTLTLRSKNKTQYSNGTHTLEPGLYVGGISISGQANVALQPGVYYMLGGGFSSSTQGSLTGKGVMIYSDPRSISDKIDISGPPSAYVNLTAPTTGPYQGILFWQRRNSNVPMNITGNGSMNMTGLFYAAGAELKVTGNGAQDVIGSQYISYNLTLGGNGNFAVNWTPESTPGTRDIWLVE